MARIMAVACIFVVFFVLTDPAFAGGPWSYGITATDTPTVIDSANTTAVVDTSLREIRLPSRGFPNIAAFAPDGSLNYAVVTTAGVRSFFYDGTGMRENLVASVSLSNTLSLALPSPFPDVAVATATGVQHFSFDGAGMTENPSLAVSGLTGVVAISSIETGNMAILTGDSVRRFLFDGTGMVGVPALEPGVVLTSPLALALAGNNSLVVLEQNRARHFSFTGTGMTENPALSVTGIANAAAIAMEDGELAIIEGTRVNHYTFDGTQMVLNPVLSVTGGLTRPMAVAFRPGHHDRIIIDGTQVLYYTFDGTQMVHNPVLSVTVSDLLAAASFAATASAQSQGRDPGVNVTRARVRANHSLPDGTSVTYQVTANGTDWVTRWRVRGLATSTVLEISPDNGLSWQLLGDAAQASPAVNRPELWAEVLPGRSVRWRAVLATAIPAATPRIMVQGGVAVIWEANAAPNQPTMTVPGWFYTTTPTFNWTFSDPNPGDTQSAFQLLIRRQSDNALVYDSAKVMSAVSSHTIPTSQIPDLPGPLWQSGVFAFTVEVRVWDQVDTPSVYSLAHPFRVLAFERPRIAEIVSPPAGQTAPVIGNPSTHIMITPGMAAGSLPRIKAGSRVTIILDSVGPVNTPADNVASFPYGAGLTATVSGAAAANPLGSNTNRWTIPFWTEASLGLVPDGTVVRLNAAGTGTEGGTTVFDLPPYAAGVARTESSVFADWFVVLQGSVQ